MKQPDQSPTTAEHRRRAPRAVRCAVITVSDTRTTATDTGGDLLAELLQEGGHTVLSRQLVPDDPAAITPAVQSALTAHAEAILITGGSGIGPRDRTPEAVTPLLDREIPGFGELFRQLSWQEIGAAAMLSRALAGVSGRTLIVVLPGSPHAIRLAMEKLLVPELGHLVSEVRPETRAAA